MSLASPDGATPVTIDTELATFVHDVVDAIEKDPAMRDQVLAQCLFYQMKAYSEAEKAMAIFDDLKGKGLGGIVQMIRGK